MSDSQAESPARYLENLSSGALLLARDALTDPNFSNGIVLVCQYGEDGAYGLVLNRPSHMPLGEIFEHPPAGFGGPETPRRVYIGGPVQPTELQILQVLDAGIEPVTQSLEVAENVHLGGAWQELEDILSRDPRHLRLFLGYSGWGKGQLEEEIEAGAWEVIRTDIRKLLAAPDSVWASGREALREFLATI
jgi:putative transcriptional regulator